MSGSSSPNSGKDSSLYKSALDNLTLSSLEDDTSVNSPQKLDISFKKNSSDFSQKSISSESSDSFEEDRKSYLTNKAISKVDNSANDVFLKNTEKNPVYLFSSEENNYDKVLNNSAINCNDLQNELDPESDSKKKKKSPREIQIYDTIEEFENNLPPTVTKLTTPFGSKIYLVGTAHFSEESQDDVSYVIRNVCPDIVMVELCPSRIHILRLDEKTLLEEAKNINLSKIRSVIQTNGFVNGLFYIMFLNMNAQIAKQLGMAPGGEFRTAFREVSRLSDRGNGAPLLQLGDRPINITLQRALGALSLWQTIKLVWCLSFIESPTIEEVEECKQKDLLVKLMKEMAGEFPAFSDVFVKERDLYLCHSLQVAALPNVQSNGIPKPVKVVGIIGIGHVPGIVKNWSHVDPKSIEEILKIPPARLSMVLLKYTIKYGVIVFATYGFVKLLRPKLRGIF